MGFIYVITSPSQKQYVGQCIGSVEKRFKKHISQDRVDRLGCRVLARAAQKYGWENLKCETLLQINDQFLNEYESKFIAMYRTMVPNGYNQTAGGGGVKGFKHSEEAKQKMSDQMRLSHKDPVYRAKYLEGIQKRKPRKGIPMSESAKKKSSETRKRKYASGELKVSDKQRAALAEGRKKGGCDEKRGSVSFCKYLNGPKNWVARGPYPNSTPLGYHASKEDAEMALRIYKHLHPSEFSNKEDNGSPITQSQIDDFHIAMQVRKRRRVKRGSISFNKKQQKFIVGAPCPTRKYIGTFKTREEAEHALAEYKRENPSEFD